MDNTQTLLYYTGLYMTLKYPKLQFINTIHIQIDTLTPLDYHLLFFKNNNLDLDDT